MHAPKLHIERKGFSGFRFGWQADTVLTTFSCDYLWHALSPNQRERAPRSTSLRPQKSNNSRSSGRGFIDTGFAQCFFLSPWNFL